MRVNQFKNYKERNELNILLRKCNESRNSLNEIIFEVKETLNSEYIFKNNKYAINRNPAL
jgi:hypothetical protein